MKPGVYWATYDLGEEKKKPSHWPLIARVSGKAPFLKVNWAIWAHGGAAVEPTVKPWKFTFGPRIGEMPNFEFPDDKVLILYHPSKKWLGCLVSPEAIFPISHDITESDDPHSLIEELIGEE